MIVRLGNIETVWKNFGTVWDSWVRRYWKSLSSTLSTQEWFLYYWQAQALLCLSKKKRSGTRRFQVRWQKKLWIQSNNKNKIKNLLPIRLSPLNKIHTFTKWTAGPLQNILKGKHYLIKYLQQAFLYYPLPPSPLPSPLRMCCLWEITQVKQLQHE